VVSKKRGDSTNKTITHSGFHRKTIGRSNI
jgi:hypothetical protein